MLFVIFVFVVAASGCDRSQPASQPSAAGGGTSSMTAEGAMFLLADEPRGAVDVIKVRETAKDGDEVVIVGRIGGKENPWIDKRAAFSIVDSSLKPCNELPGDTCQTPWDYCCEADLGAATAMIKIVDEQGDLVKVGAKELLDVKELQTLVVRGKAERDEAGNLTVLANQVYVKK
jgi:hypothetical protein